MVKKEKQTKTRSMLIWLVNITLVVIDYTLNQKNYWVHII